MPAPLKPLAESAYEDDTREQCGDAKNSNGVDGTGCRAQDAEVIEDEADGEERK